MQSLRSRGSPTPIPHAQRFRGKLKRYGESVGFECRPCGSVRREGPFVNGFPYNVQMLCFQIEAECQEYIFNILQMK